VARSVAGYSPDAVLVVVTNPVDAMTYAAWKASGFESRHVIGMAGVLDTARFRTFIAEEVDCLFGDIEAMVIGSHGDDMVPLISHAKIKRRSITEFLTEKQIDAIIKKTRFASQKIIELTNRSTVFAPAGSIAKMVEAILNDTMEILPCSAYLEGQYGYSDVYIGIPAVIGRNGIENIIEFELDEREKRMFEKTVQHAIENIEKFSHKEKQPEKDIDSESPEQEHKTENVSADNGTEGEIKKMEEDIKNMEIGFKAGGTKKDKADETATENAEKTPNASSAAGEKQV